MPCTWCLRCSSGRTCSLEPCARWCKAYNAFHLKCHDCQNRKNEKTWKMGLFLLFLAKLTWVDSKRDLLCSSFYFFIILRVVTF